MRLRYFVFCLFITLHLSKTYSKESSTYSHYTIEDGLSNNNIQSIVQDKDGFIWVATNDGLNRFDGATFKTFRYNKDDSTSIIDNDVLNLYVDSDYTLWASFRNHDICRYNPLTERFDRVSLQKPEFRGNFLFSTITQVQDVHKNIWMAGRSGIIIYNKKDQSKQYIQSWLNKQKLLDIIEKSKNIFPKELKNLVDSLPVQNGQISKLDLHNLCSSVFGVAKTKELMSLITIKLMGSMSNSLLDFNISTLHMTNHGQTLWIGYDNYGFSKYDLISRTYTHYYNPQNGILAQTFCLFGDNLYVGYEWGQIDILNLKTGVVRNIKLPNVKHIRQITKMNSRQLLIVSKQRTLLYDVHNEDVTDFCEQNNLDENTIGICNYIDKQGNLWFGTYDGLFLLSRSIGFKNITTANGLYSDKVSALAVNNGNICVGYYNEGIDVYSLQWIKKQRYLPSKTDKKAITPESVLNIFTDLQGNLWSGSYNGGLQKLNSKTNSFISYKNNPKDAKTLPVNDVRAMAEDNNHRFWLATHGGGLSVFDQRTATFKNYAFSYFKHWESQLPSDWLNDIKIDPLGNVWIATSNGLCRFDTAKNSFYSFREDNSILPSSDVRALFIDNHQNVWIGTKRGLLVYLTKQQKLQLIMLANNAQIDIKAIVQDKKGHFWVSTSNGLYSLDAYSNGLVDSRLINTTVIKYDKNDGLLSTEFYDRAGIITKDGLIVFGSNKGITAFYPDSLRHNLTKPAILVTNFSLFGYPVEVNKEYDGSVILSKSISYVDTIFLRYDQNVFSITFTALNFIIPHKNAYRYKLEGFENQWHYTKNHEVSYNYLKPGEYHFRVIACNNDGLWNNEGKTLTIIIEPPFWNTIWFKLLLFIATFICIVAIYYYRSFKILQKNQLLEETVKSRTREIEEKNHALQDQTEELNQINSLLEDRRSVIEQQAQKLTVQRDELSQLNATKDKLFSILAHDLKAPFGTILGFSDLLLRNIDTYSPDKIKTQVKYIRDSSHFTYELLENLLQWSRMQRGVIEFTPELFGFEEFISDCLKVSKQQALRKNILLDLVINEPNKMIYADVNMLSTVFRNLVSNAIKYSEKNTTITVKVTIDEATMTVNVIDTGAGIADEIKTKLFIIGHNNSRTGTAGEKGTGLGLLICADFIARHDGTIGVESEVGEGSNFFFTIPIQKPI